MSCVERGTGGLDRTQPFGTSFHALRRSDALVLEKLEDETMRGWMITKAAIVRGCGFRILVLLLAAGPASRAALASSHEEQAGPLRVGWAMTDLTPDGPVHIAAGGSLRVSEGVMDPIMATVLVLESVADDGSADMLIMVGCDLAIIRNELRDRVRRLVARSQPQIDVEKIVLNATHNHGAPCVRTDPELAAELAKYGLEVPAEWSYYGVAPDEQTMSPVGFLEFAAPRIAAAIGQAWNSRKPGGVSFGLGHAVVSHNRLVTYRDGRSQQFGNLDRPNFSHIEGYEDHSVGLLYTYDAGGELTGVVVNVPCAAWGMGSRITADFWHETRRELRRRLGESLYVLQQVAASAEQWPMALVDRRAEQRMEKITGRTRREEIAVRIADAVTSVLPYMHDQIEWNPAFAHRVEQIKLSRQRLTEEEVESRRRDFERLLGEYRKMRQEIEANPKLRERPKWFEKISAVYWSLGRAARVLREFELQKSEPMVPVEVHVVRIGEMAIATFPLAPYLDFGIQIKARSKAVQTFTVQTAAGHYRYLPTERAVAGGAYGAVPESIVFGPQGGHELVEGTLGLIESLWAEK
jgi:hypothetical protein